jgi:hypothetical protein
MTPRFPQRIYTAEEVERARRLAASGFKHRLVLKGSPDFQRAAKAALAHVKTAGFYDFVKTYIRQIVEIDGFSQLRDDEAAIWVNTPLLANPIEAAGFIVQKAYLMQEFLNGRPHFGGAAEAKSVEKRVAFLRALAANSPSPAVREECKQMLKRWAESGLAF